MSAMGTDKPRAEKVSLLQVDRHFRVNQAFTLKKTKQNKTLKLRK